jgi:hypothetical protein
VQATSRSHTTLWEWTRAQYRTRWTQT